MSKKYKINNDEIKLFKELDKRWSNGENIGGIVLSLRNELWYKDQIKINGYTYLEYKKICKNRYKQNCIIVDLDGTTAIEKNKSDIPTSNNREDWDKFHIDRQMYSLDKFSPAHKIIYLIQYYYEHFFNKPYIIFLTAREDTFNGEIRKNTQLFIDKYFSLINKDDILLFMREENDYRKSHEVKESFLLDKILPHYNVVMAFDDEENNIQMFNKHGITCLKVYL